MKHSVISLAFAAALLSACQQDDSSLYQIGTWNGFRSAAVSLTFDDNCANQFDVALPILDEFDVKATFYPIVNKITDWTPLRKCAANGHEIGSHTYSHNNLSTLSADEVARELSMAYDTIRSRVPMTDCSSIAYPFCAMTDSALVAKHHVAARICDGKIVNASPNSYMAISSFSVGSETNYLEAIDLIGIFGKALSQKGWAVILFHEIDNGEGYSPFPSIELEKSLEYLTENDTCYWVSTFANVAKYAKERDSAKVVVKSENDGAWVLNVNSNLDANVFNVPITLRRVLPIDWQKVDVSQNGNDCNAYVIDNMLYFDVVPNGEDITISKRE